MSSNLQSLADQLNAGFGALAGESLRALNRIAAWLNELRTTRPDVFAADGTLLSDYAERLQQALPEPQVLLMPDNMLASEPQNGNYFRFEALVSRLLPNCWSLWMLWPPSISHGVRVVAACE